MDTAGPSARNCRQVFLVCFLVVALSAACLIVRAQSASQSSTPAQTADAQAPGAAPAEITSRDEATTFKVNVNLVLVRVVVRDGQGKAIGNLHKEDFQLFDNRKPQVISQFSAEQPGSHAATVHETREVTAGETTAETTTVPVAFPERYIAYVFDDIHLNFGDLAQVRNAADRHMASLRPTDRAAIFSTSGQTQLDFTDDHTQLHETLIKLQPRPVTSSGLSGCFTLTYYMADLIENRQDPQALAVATEDALECDFNSDRRFLREAQQMAHATAMQTLSGSFQESHLALTVLNDVIRRISAAPGQRSVVLVSPGFLTPQMEFEYGETINRALRSQVIIGALDARGLYVVPPGGDIRNPGMPNPLTLGQRQLYAIQEASADADIMAVLADATGGTFFQNSNDLDEGFRRVASTPEYSYVLSFSPQNLKLDGSFHNLKVTVKAPGKFTVQARRGYFAPKHAADPAQQAKQEIEEAVFSQEEVHSLPVELHTQFFKSSDSGAKLTVLAHIDVRRLRLRKVDGRNNDELTIVAAVFNRNGNLIQGNEKTLTMHLKDETLEKKMGSGITLKSSFDVPSGSYLVRLVVRDAEAQLVSAANDAVRIP